MAKNKVEIVVDADVKEAERKLGGFGKTLSGLGDIGKTAIGVALGGAITALPGMIAGAAGSIVGFVKDAADVQAVSKTFDKLADSIDATSDVLLKDLQKATRGMVKDSELMQAANKFMAMGIATSAEEVANLSEVATQLGMAMGEDATESMENFALMMANQSIPRLDSFGLSSGIARERMAELLGATTKAGPEIQQEIRQASEKMLDLANKIELAKVKQGEFTEKTKESTKLKLEQDLAKWTAEYSRLEDAADGYLDELSGLSEATGGLTKEQAFMQAVMEQAGDTMAKVGEQGTGAKASIARIETTFANLKETLGAALMPAIEQVLNAFSGIIDTHGPGLREIIKQAGEQFSLWVKDVLPKVVDWFRNELVPTIRDQVIPAAMEIIAWIKNEAVPWIKDKLIPAIKDVVEWFKEIWLKFQEAREKLGTTIDQIKFIFENLGNYFKIVGGNIVDNLKQGIEDAWNTFVNWIKQRAQELIDHILSSLGFGSPSTIFVGIGKGMMESMALGIGEGVEMPISAAVTAGSMAAGGAAAGMQQHDHWNLTINSQATTEDVKFSYDTMRAMAGA